MKDLIDRIIEREGGEKVTDDPSDSGGRTQYGITEKSHPEVWEDGKVTLEEAREIYKRKYIQGPKLDQLSGLLQEFMVDWGVMSGPQFAIMQLQKVLGVDVDGVIGPQTLAAIDTYDNEDYLLVKLLKARVLGLIRIATRSPKDVKFLYGWVKRVFDLMEV